MTIGLLQASAAICGCAGTSWSMAARLTPGIRNGCKRRTYNVTAQQEQDETNGTPGTSPTPTPSAHLRIKTPPQALIFVNILED